MTAEPKTREARHYDGMYAEDGTENDIWPGDTVTVYGTTYRMNSDGTYTQLSESCNATA